MLLSGLTEYGEGGAGGDNRGAGQGRFMAGKGNRRGDCLRWERKFYRGRLLALGKTKKWLGLMMVARGEGFVALGRVGTRKATMAGWSWHEEDGNGDTRRSRVGEGEGEGRGGGKLGKIKKI